MAVELGLPGVVDDTHPARADEFKDLQLWEGRPDGFDGGISRAGRERVPASLASAAPDRTQVGQRPRGASAGMGELQRGQPGTEVLMTRYLRKRRAKVTRDVGRDGHDS